MAIDNWHKKLVKVARVVPESGDILSDRQTDTHTHTDVLTTILRNRSSGRSNKINSAIQLMHSKVKSLAIMSMQQNNRIR